MRLSDIYSDQAKHFYHTRKRPRPEMEYFINTVKNLPLKGRFVDLGCGAGRVYPRLQDIQSDVMYTGVDNAQGFISLAKDLYPDAHFYCQDMLQFLLEQEQQSLGGIMAIASIQHLQTTRERQDFFNLAYKTLEYGGCLCLTNRSFSYRFLKKYWKYILFAQYQRLGTFGQTTWNDLSIPWKDPDRQNNGKIYQRYYHIYTLTELEHLAKQAGFSIEKLGYVGQDGSRTMDWTQARNIVMICKK